MPDSIQDLQDRIDIVARRIARLNEIPQREAKIAQRIVESEARLRAAWHSITH